VAIAAAVGQPDAYAGELPVAYVTLKPGSHVTAAELLDAARELVPERAAVPVRVEILPQMILTAVGKVAKAELRMKAAEHVLRDMLALHAPAATVQVQADMRRGVVAFVQCGRHGEAKVREVLGGFSIALDVSLSGDAS
jgi:fatty-acyl-CoA synthase